MRLLFAVLLCALFAAPALSTAPAPKAGAPRVLVVASNKSGNWQLYLVPAGGGEVKQLTENKFSDTEPVWSPDGKRIAFISNRTGQSDLWLMNADGTEPEQLTKNGSGTGTGLRWSPDGKQIAFTGQPNGVYQIMAAEVATGNVTQLTGGPANCLYPSWSPDGKKLSFAFLPGRMSIYTMTADGKDQTELTDKDGGLNSVWSPGGHQLAYVTKGAENGWQVFTIGADGKNKKQLTTTRNGYGARDPLWSPDGGFISFTEIVDEKLQVAVMKADGSEPKVITSKHEHTLARWAPDGKSLSYVRSEKGQPPVLWVSDADGRNAKELLGGVGKWAAEWKPK